MIYLDHAATTEPHEEVIAAIQPYLEDHYCNPSAVYATDEADAVRNARAAIADLLGTSLAFGAVRFSLGRDTTSEDIQYVKDRLGHVLEGATI
jgi:cysteine sulfinate desulfinase/cysteine desulfurase-like protein